MLNLNEELSKLKDLESVLGSAIDKTQIELNSLNNEESNVVIGFMEELKDSMTTGKGIEELQQKVKDYANNRQ